MVLQTAATNTPHPDAVEFVRFCYHRRRVGWPELYDEMCAVAGRGLFRGLSTDDLGGVGVGFSLFDMPALASLASQVVAEELALRRPMRVVLAESPDSLERPPAPDSPNDAQRPKLRAIPITPEERPFEARPRLSLASSGA
jgi:hypothetical protein